MWANIDRIKAQELLKKGISPETPHEEVYRLYMQAYDDPKLAEEAEFQFIKSMVNRGNRRET